MELNTTKEAKRLLKEYKSELKELAHKRKKIKKAVVKLETELGIVPKKSKKGKAKATKRPTKPLASNGHTKAKPSKAQKVLNGGGAVKMHRQRALNGFDHCVINAIKENGKMMINQELTEVLSKYSEESGFGMNEDQIRIKLNQTLQKLANRRGILVKSVYPGKGYAYGLQEWINRRGNIAVQHRR